MRAQDFIDALWTLEVQGDVEPLLELFSDDVSLRNPIFRSAHRGLDQARRFWRQYRHLFRVVRSEFHHVVEDEASALLEWTTRGKTRSGAYVEYDGVTVLEFDRGAITSFRAYFDPKRLQAQIQAASAHAPM